MQYFVDSYLYFVGNFYEIPFHPLYQLKMLMEISTYTKCLRNDDENLEKKINVKMKKKTYGISPVVSGLIPSVPWLVSPHVTKRIQRESDM